MYAGVDPISKKRHYLKETVPAGSQARRTAEKVRTRLLKQVDDRQAPRTNATVNQLLDRYLEMLDVEPTRARSGTQTWEKDTKTHQRRRITLDETTVALLRAFRSHVAAELAQLGVELGDDAYLFSREPDRSTWLRPSSVSQRYARMCKRLGWDMDIKELRHYSATELIAAGVDVRTVAGRLGHGGGGVTTLRVYSAWRPEADQRAASTVADRLPAPLLTAPGVTDLPAMPTAAEVGGPGELVSLSSRSPSIRAAIACGALRPGDPLPPVAELATRYGVALSTAHRAITDLTAAGFVTVSRGRRATVL